MSVRVFWSVVVLSLAVLVISPIPEASAHSVVCTNGPQEPFFNSSPSPGRAVVQGATIIDCAPTAPDGQRTEVQIQIYYSSWADRGDSYVSLSNAQTHRVYDSTTCREDIADLWRTKAVHSGTHGNTVITTKYSGGNAFPCYYNV